MEEFIFSNDILLTAFAAIALGVFLIEKWNALRQPYREDKEKMEERIKEERRDLDERLDKMDNRLVDLEKNAVVVNTRLSHGDKQFEEIKEALQRMEEKSDKRYDEMNQRLSFIESEIKQLHKALNGAVLAGVGGAKT